jgi:hypothetical protein
VALYFSTNFPSALIIEVSDYLTPGFVDLFSLFFRDRPWSSIPIASALLLIVQKSSLTKLNTAGIQRILLDTILRPAPPLNFAPNPLMPFQVSESGPQEERGGVERQERHEPQRDGTEEDAHGNAAES